MDESRGNGPKGFVRGRLLLAVLLLPGQAGCGGAVGNSGGEPASTGKTHAPVVIGPSSVTPLDCREAGRCRAPWVSDLQAPEVAGFEQGKGASLRAEPVAAPGSVSTWVVPQVADLTGPAPRAPKSLAGATAGSLAGPAAAAPGPDCSSAGTPDPAVQQEAMQTIETIRALHGLPPVQWRSAAEPAQWAAARMMAASGVISRSGAQPLPCLNPLALQGARQSLLALGDGSLSVRLVILGWLKGNDPLQPDALGHRRWLLDPFWGQTAMARVKQAVPQRSAVALQVVNHDPAQAVAPATALAPTWIAYPYRDYPASFFDPQGWLSFSLLLYPDNLWKNQAVVDFHSAQVEVRERDGTLLPVTAQRADNRPQGLPNHLQFRVPGLLPGVLYDVTVRGVRVHAVDDLWQPRGVAVERTYRYWFRLDPTSRGAREPRPGSAG